MLYGIIRLLPPMAVIVFVLRLYLTGTKKISSWVAIAAVFVAPLLLPVLVSFPVENRLFDFSSPEQAFRYVSFDRVDAVVEGEDSALVVREFEGSASCTFLPRSGDGWNISIDNSYSKWFVSPDIVTAQVLVYNPRGTGDYYIEVVQALWGSETQFAPVEDSHGSSFVRVVNGRAAYDFAWVGEPPAGYIVRVGGTEVAIDWEQMQAGLK